MGRSHQEVVVLDVIRGAEDVGDRVGDVVGLEDVESVVGLFGLLLAVVVLFGKFRFDEAGTDCGDSDVGVPLSQFAAKPLGQRADGVLRRRIHAAGAGDAVTGHGADVDDVTGDSAVLHVVECLAGADGESQDVDLEHRPPGLGVSVEKGLVFTEAGVVDEDVDSAEALTGPVEEFVDVVCVAKIGADGEGGAAVLFDVVDESVETLFSPGAGDDVETGVGEASGDGAADTARGTGDDGALSFPASEIGHDILQDLQNRGPRMMAIEGTERRKSTRQLGGGNENVGLQCGVFIWAMTAALAVFIGSCSTTSESEPEGHDAISGGESTEAAEEERAEAESKEAEEPKGEVDGPPQYWWGPIQGRADEAFDELEADVETCLEGLGDESQVREIGLEATRPSRAEPYELVAATSYPTPADEAPCVAKIAEDYVDAVGSSIADDFDTWVTTFIHRGEPVAVEDCTESEQTVCTSSSDEIEVGQSVSGETECGTEFVDEIQNMLRDQRSCWSGSRFQDRVAEYEEKPIELRALMYGDVVVEDEDATVLLRYNRPWVEEMVTCQLDALDEEEMLSGVETEIQACRSALTNRAIHLWFGPAFSYVVE